MISRCINQVRLASDVADEFFPNIKGDNYRGDVSWLATMRALLPSRIPTGQEVRLHIVQNNMRFSEMSQRECMEGVLDRVDCVTPYTITVVSVAARGEDMEKLSAAARRNGICGHSFVDAIYQRYHSEKKNPGYVLVFVDQETANTVIIVSSLTMMMWHSLQGFMRTYFKKAFEEHPITEDEKNLLRALVNVKGYEAYMELIEKFEKQYDFRSAIIRKALVGFTTSAKKRNIQMAEQAVKDAEDCIRQRQNEIARQIRRREEAQIRLYGLKFAMEEDKSDKELTEYFLQNKQLVFDDQHDNCIHYWVKGDLCYFDEQSAESYIKTIVGYMYEGCREYDIDTEDFKKVLCAIFMDRTVKVEMCAAYKFIFDDNEVNIEIDSEAEVPVALRNHLKNPHSMYNRCWGTHAANLSEALSDGDYTSAVAVTIAATCELNVVDVSTAQFSRWLCSSEQKCLRLPDGSHMTCKEYIENMKDEGRG